MGLVYRLNQASDLSIACQCDGSGGEKSTVHAVLSVTALKQICLHSHSQQAKDAMWHSAIRLTANITYSRGKSDDHRHFVPDELCFHSYPPRIGTIQVPIFKELSFDTHYIWRFNILRKCEYQLNQIFFSVMWHDSIMGDYCTVLHWWLETPLWSVALLLTTCH